ncbi:hypothetical protein AGMMS50239_34300 [Bacteroidia bacterium]|nr:hypothetical protein AGMMS50239_34300 [Bacteroidia bacterium]
MKTKILISISIVLLFFVSEVYSQFKVNADGSAQFKVNNVNASNPFTNQTEIKYFVATGVKNAYICIFDMQGKMLQKIDASTGQNSVIIQGSTLQAGIYLYALVADGQEIDTKRMILTK